MGFISPQFIEQLLSRVDIIDVINPKVPLKQKGRHLTACCPFHKEKLPSFSVSSEKQFYYCFGCGANGNAISFLMQFEGLTFVESVEAIASSFGIEVVYENTGYINKSQNNKMEPLYLVLQEANVWFQQQLSINPERQQAVNYLKKRGLSAQTCKDYQVGFAPNNGLLTAIGSNKDKVQQMLESGLLSKNDDGDVYERFRNRIQFPIHNTKGKVVGFGGRTLINHKAKYYNSPASDVFHKSEEIYGFYQARATINKKGMALLVEGYMDVVMLAHFGIKYAVATLGTASNTGHFKKIFATAKKIICCFDGDKAGLKAAITAMREVLPLMRAGRSFGFVFLPKGDDPDSYVNLNGKQKFEQLINRAKPLDVFMFSYLKQNLDIKSVEGRAEIAKKGEELIKNIPQGYYYDLMIKKLAQLTQLKEKALLEDIRQERRHEHQPTPRKIIKSARSLYPLADKTIALLIEYPKCAIDLQINTVFKESKHPKIKKILKIIQIIQENPDINTANIFEKFRNGEDNDLSAILSKKLVITLGKNQKESLSRIQAEIIESINIIETQINKNKITMEIKNLKSDDKSAMQAFSKKLSSNLLLSKNEIN